MYMHIHIHIHNIMGIEDLGDAYDLHCGMYPCKTICVWFKGLIGLQRHTA